MKVKHRFRDDIFSFLFGSQEITAKADMKSVVPQAYCNPLLLLLPAHPEGQLRLLGLGGRMWSPQEKGRARSREEGHWLGHPPHTSHRPSGDHNRND